MSDKLKPCPFCGGEAVRRIDYVECGACWAQGPIDQEIYAGWNTRAALSAPQADAEAVTGGWFSEGTKSEGDLCDDCPPVGYPTDNTRCLPCPRRAGESRAKATEGKAGNAGGQPPVRQTTTGTGLRVGEADAVQPATSEIMDVTGRRDSHSTHEEIAWTSELEAARAIIEE